MPYGKRLQKFWDSLPENEKEEIKRESEALKTEYNSPEFDSIYTI